MSCSLYHRRGRGGWGGAIIRAGEWLRVRNGGCRGKGKGDGCRFRYAIHIDGYKHRLSIPFHSTTATSPAGDKMADTNHSTFPRIKARMLFIRTCYVNSRFLRDFPSLPRLDFSPPPPRHRRKEENLAKTGQGKGGTAAMRVSNAARGKRPTNTGCKVEAECKNTECCDLPHSVLGE